MEHGSVTMCFQTELTYLLPLYVCSTWEFQALQLIVIVVFGAVDKLLAFCMLVQFLEILFEMKTGL